MSRIVELDIERVGARGDGIGESEGKPVFVAFAAPGDRVRVRLGERRGDGIAAELVEVVVAGAARATPACRHFGACGGCAFQHLAPAAYAEAKRRLVVDALARHGLGGVVVAPLRVLPAGTRRRTRFAVRRRRVGFQARASHEVVALSECAVLAPEIVRLLPRLAALRGNAGYTVTLADSGLDVVAERETPPDLAALETLGVFAAAADLARLSWRQEGEPVPVAQRRPVRVTFGGVAVDLPADAFLQATQEAEAALTGLVLAGTAGAARVADLFAGIGTFSFPLAAHARVDAVEGAAAALGALRTAAARAGLRRLATEQRDLARRPLEPAELAPYDAVVFDPPRAGAAAQAAMLARSRVARVVAVSCNPATFARDAATLVGGGYRLGEVTPVDQFVWSAHVELVAVFTR
jgi:23S rRNA (uracil1939-C5)-methyltransferase